MLNLEDSYKNILKWVKRKTKKSTNGLKKTESLTQVYMYKNYSLGQIWHFRDAERFATKKTKQEQHKLLVNGSKKHY